MDFPNGDDRPPTFPGRRFSELVVDLLALQDAEDTIIRLVGYPSPRNAAVAERKAELVAALFERMRLHKAANGGLPRVSHEGKVLDWDFAFRPPRLVPCDVFDSSDPSL